MRILVEFFLIFVLCCGSATGRMVRRGQDVPIAPANSVGGSNPFKYFVAVSSDGNYIASRGVNDSTILIWNVKANRQQSVLHSGDALVFGAAFQPMTDVLALADTSGRVSLWHVSNGKRILEFVGHSDTVHCVRFSPDGNTLASAGQDQSIILWNMRTRKAIHRFYAHKSPVWSLCFRPHSPYLYSGAEDGKIAQWNLKTYQHVAWLKGHNATVRSLVSNSTGNRMASCGNDQKIIIWDAPQNKSIHLLPCSSIVWSCDFLPGNEKLAAGSEDKTIQVWDARSGQSLQIDKMPEAVLCVKALANGAVVFATRTDMRR